MMKKLLAMLTLLIAGVLTMSAQHGYRGFADISLGAGIGKTTGFSTALSTTHGYQCNGHIFLGAGLNIGYSSADRNYDGESFDLMFPVYAALRYDYSLVSKRSFYYDLKIGYPFIRRGIWGGMGFGLRIGQAGRVSYNVGLKFNVLYDDPNGCVLTEPMACFGIDF